MRPRARAFLLPVVAAGWVAAELVTPSARMTTSALVLTAVGVAIVNTVAYRSGRRDGRRDVDSTVTDLERQVWDGATQLGRVLTLLDDARTDVASAHDDVLHLGLRDLADRLDNVLARGPLSPELRARALETAHPVTDQVKDRS